MTKFERWGLDALIFWHIGTLIGWIIEYVF